MRIGIVLLMWLMFLTIDSLAQVNQGGGDYKLIRRRGAFFTAPLIECDYNAPFSPPFQKELETLVKESKANGNAINISIYFQALNSGQTYGIDEERYYAPASMMKAADMMHIFKMAEDDPTIMDQKIEIHKKRISLLGESRLKDGESYSVMRVLAEMILESDNQAMFALQNHFRNDQLWSSVFRELGQEIDFRADNLKSLNPKMYSTIFKALYNGTYLNTEWSDKALKLLASTSFGDGIVRGVNDTSVVIANKFGFREWSRSFQFHETAIVYLDGMPYVLSVMTEGLDANKLTKIIADVSSIVYKSCQAELKKAGAIDLGNRSKPGTLVHPLLECPADPNGLSAVGNRIQKTVDDLMIDPAIKDVSVYAMQLSDAKYLTVNPESTFRPGSLMRVPHMMAILKASERNPILLDQRFKYERDASLFKLKMDDSYMVPGQDYSVKQLLERMVVFSDKDALDMIYESTLNRADVWQNLFNTLGLSHLWQSNRVANSIRSEEMALIFKTLYNSTYLNDRNSELALEIMSRSKFKLGIRKGIRQDDYAATKFGEMEYEENGQTVIELHEAGIVYCEDNPYVICVMTRGTDFDKQASAIEQVSRALYKELSR